MPQRVRAILVATASEKQKLVVETDVVAAQDEEFLHLCQLISTNTI